MKLQVIVSLLFAASFAYGQTATVPGEAIPFIPAGYGMLDYQTGDLNGDKKLDAILILKKAGEDSFIEETPNRPLLVLICEANGKLKQVIKNDHAVMRRQCGGVFGGPYEGVEIKNNGFSISFYGGSSWRWGYSEQGYEDSKWRVAAVKTYFFDSPKLGSKPRKAYLLKGNAVSAVRQLKNFIEVNFENSKGEITSGFILRKDLAPAR